MTRTSLDLTTESGRKYTARCASAFLLAIYLAPLVGIVGFDDARFEAVYAFRNQTFEVQPLIMLAIFELAVSIFCVVTLWFASVWYVVFSFAQVIYAVIYTSFGGPSIDLGVVDAFMSRSLFLAHGFGICLVLVHRGASSDT